MRTVRQIAKASGISVRTLHYYDAIGLLRPGHVGSNGYRYYGREELLRLQQILFYRELGMPLAEIAAVLDDPAFEPAAALRSHRMALQERIARYQALIRTIDRTIESLEEDFDMKETDYYAGIGPEVRERWQREAESFWGPEAVAEAQAKAAKRSESELKAIQVEMEDIRNAFRRLHREGALPKSEAVQSGTDRHYRWISQSWNVDADAFRRLARYYAENPEFRGVDEENSLPGCAEFMTAAMEA